MRFSGATWGVGFRVVVGVLGLGLAAVVSGCGAPSSSPVVSPVPEVPDVVTSPSPTLVAPSPSPSPDDTRPETGGPAMSSPDIIMRCGDRQLKGEIYPNRMEITIDGEDFVLVRVEAEDGELFSDGSFTLWNLETEWAFLEEETGEVDECFVAAIS